jgi:hypothetical protein
MDSPVSAAKTVKLDALAAALGPTRDGDEWQDGLDFLAAAAGLKPAAMFGRGGGAIETWRALAQKFALPAIEAAPWDAAPPENFLPLWYLEAASARRARHKVLLVARDREILARAAELAAHGRFGAAEEAEILGYPHCCVVEHHAAALALERQTAYLLAHAHPGDEARIFFFVASGATPYVPPPPITPSRWTSVNLCRACASSDTSPARALEQAYRALALRLNYPARA